MENNNLIPLEMFSCCVKPKTAGMILLMVFDFDLPFIVNVGEIVSLKKEGCKRGARFRNVTICYEKEHKHFLDSALDILGISE